MITRSRTLARQEIRKLVDSEPKSSQSEASVAVLDNFRASGALGMSHGDQVTQVLRKGGLEQSAVRAVQVFPNTEATFQLLKNQDGDPGARLRGFVEGTALDFLESTIAQVEHQASLGVKTVNHSQTLNAAKTAGYLFNLAIDYGQDGMDRSLTEFGSFLCDALSLPKRADWDGEIAIHQRLLDLTNDVYNQSALVRESKESFDRRLAELKREGLLYFTVAGNDGKVIGELKRMGLSAAAAAAHGLNNVPQAVVVGALDDKGTKDTSDDTVADFSVTHPEVDFLAPGVGIDLGPVLRLFPVLVSRLFDSRTFVRIVSCLSANG